MHNINLYVIFLLTNLYIIGGIGVMAKPTILIPDDATTEMPIDPDLYNGALDFETIRKIQKCDKDIDTMELCMRCAKVTKSEIVYPMCCDNEENVKIWCREYIYFGVGP